jgi:hypothetical protein
MDMMIWHLCITDIGLVAASRRSGLPRETIRKYVAGKLPVPVVLRLLLAA